MAEEKESILKSEKGKEIEIFLKTEENACGVFQLARFTDGSHHLRTTYKEEDLHGNVVKKKVSISLDENHPLVLRTDWENGTITLDKKTPSPGEKSE